MVSFVSLLGQQSLWRCWLAPYNHSSSQLYACKLFYGQQEPGPVPRIILNKSVAQKLSPSHTVHRERAVCCPQQVLLLQKFSKLMECPILGERLNGTAVHRNACDPNTLLITGQSATVAIFRSRRLIVVQPQF
jgi:hypothetical protein